MAKKITYKQAGVDIDRAGLFIGKIRKMVAGTRNAGSMDAIGGFSAFFDPAKFGIKNPILVGCTDGVGTKVKIAQELGIHDTVGIDLVAMSVNDCICSGARPVFFLDYFAVGKLEVQVGVDLIKGISRGCREAGCALIGGETAEMPGIYKKGEYDLAGFAVGIADRKKTIDGKKIRPGDTVLGLASSGFHSNGYSFVRKAFSKSDVKKYGKMILAPTTIYVKSVLDLVAKAPVLGIAHITGGGLYDNIPRILPDGCGVAIKKGSWPMPRVFELLLARVSTPERELYRTFNMGIGMVIVISGKDARKAMEILRKHKIKSWEIGKVVRGEKTVELA